MKTLITLTACIVLGYVGYENKNFLIDNWLLVLVIAWIPIGLLVAKLTYIFERQVGCNDITLYYSSSVFIPIIIWPIFLVVIASFFLIVYPIVFACKFVIGVKVFPLYNSLIQMIGDFIIGKSKL